MKRFVSVLLAAVLLLGMVSCANPEKDWQEQYDLGMRYLSEGNYEEAILAFSAAIEIDGDRPEAYMGRAEAYIAIGDHEKALKDYKRARKVARENDDEDLVDELEELIEEIEEIIDDPDRDEDVSPTEDPTAEEPPEDNLPTEETPKLDPQEAIPALNALLRGVDYNTQERNVKDWSDDVITRTIYSKLQYDDFYGEESSYLKRMGLEYTCAEDGYVHYDLKKIQELTHDTFGRAFPGTLSETYLQISGNELLLSPSAGDGLRQLLVQDVTGADGMVTAVGIAVVQHHSYVEFQGYFRATFRENANSIYGYTLETFEKTSETQMLNNLVATASSELAERTITHYASRVLDGSIDTSWVEGVAGVGVGEWIRLDTTDGSKLTLSAIELWLGYQKSQDHLQKNGWPYKLRIECEGYQQEVTFTEYTDVVVLDRPVETAWIKFTILEAAAGYRYEDTCITEIRLRGIACPEEEPEAPAGAYELYKSYFYANYSANELVCLADVTHDGENEMLVVHFSDEYHSEVFGHVYTVENGSVVEIYSNYGSDYHAGGFYSWYLVPVPGSDFCNLAWETHGMWQGVGQLTYTEYLLTGNGKEIEVSRLELDSSAEGNHDEYGMVTDAAYNTYIQALSAELADCYRIYCSHSNGSGSQALDTSPASVFAQ